MTSQEDKDREVYKSKITWLGKEVKDSVEEELEENQDNEEDEEKEEKQVKEIMVFSSDDDVAERRLLEINLPIEEEEEEESEGSFKGNISGIILLKMIL